MNKESDLKNTLVYIHLIDFKAEEFITKIAKDAEDACNRLESGFEYIHTTPDELKVFKKRK